MNFNQGYWVQLFTTRGVVAPPENDPIMLGTLMKLFRHLEHQNPSISLDFIDSREKKWGGAGGAGGGVGVGGNLIHIEEDMLYFWYFQKFK